MESTTTVCPKCGYPSSRTELCEACGALINRIRTRQGVATPAISTPSRPDPTIEGPPSFSAFNYESPVSGGSLTKAALVVLLLLGGYFGLKYFSQRSAGGGTTSQYVHELEQSAFDTRVLNAKPDETWAVDFHATWCGPCKEFAPEFDAVADKLASKVSFARVDIDLAPDAVRKLGIQGVPTVMLFRSGKVLASSSGALARNDFESWINANF